MTLYIDQVRLLFYDVQNDAAGAGVAFDDAQAAADLVIDGGPINSLELSEKATDRVDSASIELDNYGGRFSTEHPSLFQRGTRISLWLATSAPGDYRTDDADKRPPASQYGTAEYGESAYGGYTEPLYGSTLTHRWTGKLLSAPNTSDGGLAYTLSLSAGDWVFQTLKDRRHTGDYNSRPISGSQEAILNRSLRADAPEIDTDRLNAVGTTTDIQWKRRTLLDLLKTCVARGNAVARADDTALVVYPTTDLESQFEVTHESHDWYAGMTAESVSDSFANHILVVGGTQPVIDDYSGPDEVSTNPTITPDTTTSLGAGSTGRHIMEITPKGDTVSEVDVYTDPTVTDGTIQGDGIAARIQRNQNGGPVAPGDKQSDLASGQVDAQDLEPGGWTTINMSDGTVSRDTAWLILQTKGTAGQTIGAWSNPNGDPIPAYRSYYPYDVGVDRSDWESREQYGRVDDAINDDSLTTAQAAEDAAEARVDDRGTPGHVISGVQAWSERMHSLRPADCITVDAPRLTTRGGDYVVTERSTTMQANELQTELTLEHLPTL